MKLVTSIKSISLLFITFLSFVPTSYAADSELLNLDITTILPAIIALMVFALASIAAIFFLILDQILRFFLNIILTLNF